MDKRTQISEPIKAYKMLAVGNNDAEINLYGEVVDTRPIDFWTGKPIEGNFIAVDEFLADLEELSAKDTITVHINSVGGSLYGGIAIYNRLKSLAAHIITINDGLAASAGSIIFQAGNIRKVNAGSNVMIHGALGFLYGYYQVKDLRAAIKQLEAGNKAAVNIYAEASGQEADYIKTLVDKETWMTGEEAVEMGFADEVIESSTPVSLSLTADKSHLLVNGVSMPTFGLSNIPSNIPVLAATPTSPVQKTADIKNKPTGGQNKMDITNVEQLKAAYPELVEQLENAASTAGNASGIAAERARIQGIEAIESAIADKELINSAKYGDTPLTAEQLAFKAMQAQAAIGAVVLANMQQDSKNSGVEGVSATPNNGMEPSPEEKAKEEVNETLRNYKMMKNGGEK